jgi:choline dehydrogenase-like flavoprotein
MTPSAAFDVIFVGAGHHGMIAARYLTENSGSVCLRDQRPIPATPHTAPSESFMDDPQDFKKRSRTGSRYENPTSPNT